MSQEDLFGRPDPAQGRRNRDAAMERVEENAGEDWNDLAWRALEDVLQEAPREFTSERVRQVLTERGHWPPPNDPRALGPVMNRAAKKGLIRDTRKYTTSVYASSNNMPKRIWEKLR